MDNQAELTIDEMLRSIQYMINNAIKNTTQIYSGLIVSNNNDGRWNIKYNGETHPVKPYGNITPSVGQNVKVIIPQGNQAIAFFI